MASKVALAGGLPDLVVYPLNTEQLLLGDFDHYCLLTVELSALGSQERTRDIINHAYIVSWPLRGGLLVTCRNAAADLPRRVAASLPDSDKCNKALSS
jgi:hypothetical protein